MFFRQKRSGQHVYLQIVENRWEKGRSRQRVVATVGRVDQLRQSGQLDGLLQSGAKFAEAVLVLSAHHRGDVPAIRQHRLGPALIFGRLWNELQIPQVIQRLLAGRRFALPVERILFLTVLHRLFVSGSDRSCVLNWKQRYAVPGVEAVGLHQVYRARAWLGERLAEDQQGGATPFAPRCSKDVFEGALFERRRDLFSHLELVFFDTASIYFEGAGGTELGRYGGEITPEWVITYFDRKELARFPTMEEWKTPLYMLVDLVITKPEEEAVFPMDLTVKNVSAYQPMQPYKGQ